MVLGRVLRSIPVWPPAHYAAQAVFKVKFFLSHPPSAGVTVSTAETGIRVAVRAKRHSHTLGPVEL